MNSFKTLKRYDQSIWLDYGRRSLITEGELERLIKEEGVRGLIGNLSVFQKVIAGSSDYDDSLKEAIGLEPQIETQRLYEELIVPDMQMAADILRGVYEESKGREGFVSLEINPNLAPLTEGILEEARYLWRRVDRPNFMVKVPATPQGIPIIENLVAEGINVNATLILSLSNYQAVAQAYLKGLERCQHPQRVFSVASFFVRRVDKAVDKILRETGEPVSGHLQGKIAVAEAKMIYQHFKKVFKGQQWQLLKKKGARVQPLLWAEAGPKNPCYFEVLYAEELMGPGTIVSLTPASLNAFSRSSSRRPTIEEGLKEAESLLSQLASLGINLDSVAEKLQSESLVLLAESFNSLLATLKEKGEKIVGGQRDKQIFFLDKYHNEVDKRLRSWQQGHYLRRLWSRDPSLWFSEPRPEITDRLGWLELPECMFDKLEEISSFASRIKDEGISQVVLLGMGGSSLAPDVWQRTFGQAPGYPELIVLDSTHPQAVAAVEEKLDLNHTLFLVSSKSGTTLETLSLFKYFWDKMNKRVTSKAGHHFVSITDPGSPLMKVAEERNFRRVFQAKPDVGGRYSAFTDFGLVPAALIGLDIYRLLDRARVAAENCSFCVAADKAPGLILGAALGQLSPIRDKITVLASPSLESFPDWLEQLIAESTGKEGKGLVPVVNEPLASLEDYGQDRFFVFLLLEGEHNQQFERFLTALRKTGHPVVKHTLNEKFDIGREIFWWEVAVASVGSILGIHPFNQPDVQLAKDFARKAMKKAVEKSRLRQVEEETLAIDRIEKTAEALKRWLSQARSNDYFVLQAYLPPKRRITKYLQNIRLKLLKRTHLATTMGYGPRFLHSTGQLHKGGANTGLFLQIIDEPAFDLAVPETDYSFGRLIKAQAWGDYLALKQKKRRVLRLNLKNDINKGLAILEDLIDHLD